VPLSPRRYGRWKSFFSRFYRCRKDGIWDGVLTAPQRQSIDGESSIGARGLTSTLSPKRTSTRPRQCGQLASEALDHGWGRSSTGIHLRHECGGKPVTVVPLAGKKQKQTGLTLLMDLGGGSACREGTAA